MKIQAKHYHRCRPRKTNRECRFGVDSLIRVHLIERKQQAVGPKALRQPSGKQTFGILVEDIALITLKARGEMRPSMAVHGASKGLSGHGIWNSVLRLRMIKSLSVDNALVKGIQSNPGVIEGGQVPSSATVRQIWKYNYTGKHIEAQSPRRRQQPIGMNEIQPDKPYEGELVGPWNRWNEIGSSIFLGLSHRLLSTSISKRLSFIVMI
jgi:hypothetical protein